MTQTPLAGHNCARPTPCSLPNLHPTPPTIRAPGAKDVELAALLASPPFVGKSELTRCRGSMSHACDFAIAIPVRDERRRLPATLDALSAAMRAVAFKGCVVFVLNDTRDASGDLIEQWAMRDRVPFLAAEVSFDPTIRNAAHARRLALDIAARAVPSGTLFTTDADTTVGESWILRGMQCVAEGYDLMCEDVLLNEAELSTLPAQVRETGDTERAYFDLCDRLWKYWTYGRGGTLALRPSGASLAMRASSYLAIGGLPTPPAGEDRALCDALACGGFAIRAMKNLGTRTSARLTGRASGGCGDALAERASSPDPACDSRLKPVWLLHDEATLWLEIERGTSRGFHAIPRTCGPMTFSAVRRELEIARKLAATYGLADA